MSESQTATVCDDTLAGAAGSLGLPRVLIADADASSRARRARQLGARGFRVFMARTPFEAIVKASCHVPDLILVDASLGEDGLRDTTELLATCPATAHIPIVRLTPGRRLPARLTPSTAVS